MDGQFVKVGEIAAANIAQAAELPSSVIPAIAQAIEDEVNAMSAHFSFAMSDAYAQFEQDLIEAKKALPFVKANRGLVACAAGTLFTVGVVIGALLHG